MLSKGLTRKEIGSTLGIDDPNFFKGELMRVDIPADFAKELKLRKATSSSIGANDKFIDGGKTIGGVSEGTVNGIPVSDKRVKINKVK